MQERWSGGQTSIVRSVAVWQAITLAGFLAVGVGLLAVQVLTASVYGPRLEASIETLSAARLSHEAMLDQQSGLRGYLVTGDERFLEAYAAGRSSLDLFDGDLTDGVSGRGHRALLEMRLAQAAWLDRWVPRALATGEAGGIAGTSDATVEEVLVEGKDLFDAYRASQGALAETLRDGRDDAMAAQEQAVVRTALLALGIAVVVGGDALRRGRRLRRVLRDGMDGVHARLAAMDDGGAEVAQPAGPAELVEIQRGLDDARHEIAAARGQLEDQAGRLGIHNHQLAQVLRFAREVAGSLNLRYVIRGLCSATAEIAGTGRVVVWLLADDRVMLEPVADSSGPSLEPVGVDAMPVGEGPVGRAARYGRVHRHDLQEQSLVSDVLHPGEEGTLAVPMVVGAEVVGVLEIEVGDDVDVDVTTVGVLESLAVQAATAVSAARLHEHAEHLALTDALTQLPNRRRLEADLERQVSIATRYDRPLAFAMLDVDHFKAYNDELGHQTADVALQALAHLLAGSLRTGDSVYRYGGEEIAILMSETDAASGEQVAERLRTIIAHHFSGPEHPRPVTVSIGVAAIPEHATTGSALVAAADQALYAAKDAGRNRVAVAGATSV